MWHGKTFCLDCGEAMIHRDNRQPHESASAFGQLFHDEGPQETTSGDIDHYIYTAHGEPRVLQLLRIIEKFQAKSPLKGQQAVVLRLLDKIIRHAVHCPLLDDPKWLLEGSGVYIIRGDMCAEQGANQKVNFVGPQIVQNIDESPLFEAKTNEELFSWAIGSVDWHSRDNRPLDLARRTVSISEDFIIPKVARKTPALDVIKRLWQKAVPDERKAIVAWVGAQKG